MRSQKAICNYIKSTRMYNRNCKSKTITLRIDNENNFVISTILHVIFNPFSNCFGMSHTIFYRGKSIAPMTNNKMNCNNQECLERLSEKLGRGNKTRAKKKILKEKSIKNCVGYELNHQISSDTRIAIDIKSNSIFLTHRLVYKNKCFGLKGKLCK